MSLFLIVIISCAPLARASTGWDVLHQDIDAWSEENEQIDRDRLEEQADLTLEQSGSPFPAALQTETDSGGVQSKDSVRMDAFLHVTIDGTDIAFHDVPRAAWFAPYVRFIAEHTIVSGYKDAVGNPLGEFRPRNAVTLEEVAKIAVQSADLTVDSCETTAKNRSASGSWSLPYIACAEGEGWSVFSDGAVDVRRPANRSEVVVTLLQALRVPITSAQGLTFADVTLSTEFAGAIERASIDGIVSGDDTMGAEKFFRPADSMNRAELAKVVTLALQLYK